MRCLVTGGAGFIGSHLCDALLARGDEVVCVDSFNDYYDPKFKEDNISHNRHNASFSLHRTDITDMESLRKVFKEHRPEKVMHLAARAGVRPSIEQPFLYERVNIVGTLNLLELCREFNVRHFVFASSSSVYGNNRKVPFSESDEVENPISPYAATKRSGELICYTYHHLYGINITCLRFFTVYGPRGRPDMAPYLFTRLIDEGKPISRFGDGSSRRDYTYVADIVAGIVESLDRVFPYEIINLGNSQTVELNHLIGVIEEKLGKKADIIQKPEQTGDVPITFADISKAKKILGYAPTTSIEEGMGEFIDWYMKIRKSGG